MAKKTHGGKLTSSAEGSSQHDYFIIDDESIQDPMVKDKVFCPVVDGDVKSHGLNPRDYKIFPKEMFDPPSQITLIPRSEWKDRIKDMADTKSRISDIMVAHDVPCLDQDGVGYCATADTEVLTEKGWVPYPDYNWTDLLATVNPLTHRLEFQQPFEKHVYEYDGEMIYSTNRRLDFGVTPDHQMYVRKWDEAKRTLSDRYSFVRAADLGWYAGLLAAPSGWLGTELVEVEVPGDRRYDGDDFFAMLGLVVSDGFAASYPRSGDLVSFASFRPECREAIVALAARAGFREQPSRPGVWNRWGANALVQWLFANCYTGGGRKAHHKRIPDVVKCASTRQIKLFLQWFDDRSRDGRSFYSVSKRLIDDLQELHLRIGRRGTITKRPPRQSVFDGKTIRSSGEYTLTVAEMDNLCLDRKKHVETDRYKGLVYCAAVPNHTLLTRRNGSILISSNCWAHSTTGALMAARALANEKTIPLSAFAVAATIKKGRDEGGWCGLSAKFARERGIPSQEAWPQGDRDYRKHDTAAVWADAAKHKILEEWTDLTRDVYDTNLTFDQLATALLSRQPGPGDFNWWSHSILLCDLVEVEAGSYGLNIRNSWSKSWGDNGFGILRGQKAIPDSALSVRVTGASLT